MSRFKAGDRVVVNNPNLESYKQIGRIQSIDYFSGHISVYFNNWNGLGEKLLSFSEFNLDHVSESENAYIESKDGTNKMMSGNYNVVNVQFLQGTNTNKCYAFACFDKDIYPDDLVLCDTAHGYGVGRVMSIHPKSEYEGCVVTKEVICKVDFSEFEKRKELRKQKDALKKQMDKMVADNQELILYQAIAEKNPEMAAMLAEYKNLTNI